MSVVRFTVIGLWMVAGIGRTVTAETHPPEEIAALVERLLAADTQQPAIFAPDPAQPYPPDREFLFDAVRDVSPETLLEAVRFAVDATPAPEGPEGHAAFERIIREKLVKLLEYYPIVAATPLDFHRLIDVIRSGANPPVVRAFLLHHAAPGRGVHSALGEYMQAMVALDSETFDQQLANLIQNVTEPPAVQEAAIATLVARIAHEYARLLADDPLVRAHNERNGVEAHVRALIGQPDALPMAKRTQVLLERRHPIAGAFTTLFLTTANDPNRAPAVRKAARTAALETAKHCPIPNRQEILAALESTP